MSFKEDLRVSLLVKNEDCYELILTEEEYKKYRIFKKEFYGFPRICKNIAYVRSKRPLKMAVIKEILICIANNKKEQLKERLKNIDVEIEYKS